MIVGGLMLGSRLCLVLRVVDSETVGRDDVMGNSLSSRRWRDTLIEVPWRCSKFEVCLAYESDGDEFIYQSKK